MMSFSVPAFLLSANFFKPKIRAAGYAASRPIFVETIETTNPYSESRVKVENSFSYPFFTNGAKLQPRSPVAAGHVATWGANFSTRVESKNNFWRS